MFRGLSVYTGNAHPGFARDICRHLEIPLGQADVFKFANDNIFVQIQENAREHDVFIVQSLVGPSVSDAIMELLIMLDAFKRASAGRITAVMPYYAYGRSDKKDQPRVPITARLLADLITELVFTDSVPLAKPFQHVRAQTLSLAPLIGDAMHRIHTGGSVGELFT